jgi:hypothetical protein
VEELPYNQQRFPFHPSDLRLAARYFRQIFNVIARTCEQTFGYKFAVDAFQASLLNHNHTYFFCSGLSHHANAVTMTGITSKHSVLLRLYAALPVGTNFALLKQLPVERIASSRKIFQDEARKHHISSVGTTQHASSRLIPRQTTPG